MKAKLFPCLSYSLWSQGLRIGLCRMRHWGPVFELIRASFFLSHNLVRSQPASLSAPRALVGWSALPASLLCWCNMDSVYPSVGTASTKIATPVQVITNWATGKSHSLPSSHPEPPGCVLFFFSREEILNETPDEMRTVGERDDTCCV